MLPDVGITEYLVIAAVALIVVGPKDLPVLLRKLGQWVAKMRAMASEFRASFDEMARQSELDELRKEVEAMRQGQLVNPARLAADDANKVEIEQTFAEIEAGLKGEGTMLHPPMGHHYIAPQEDPEAAADAETPPPAVALPEVAMPKFDGPSVIAEVSPVEGPAEGQSAAVKPRRTRKKA